jgi:hypothetical protein
VDYYWKSEKSEYRVIEDGETEETRCDAKLPSLGHIARELYLKVIYNTNNSNL